MTFYTDYRTASKWGDCQLILCNEIVSLDESIWDNMRFNYYDEDDNTVDIFQWYLTSLNEWEVEWNEKTFDLKYTYSELLDKYILCVTHWGTSWDYVACEVKSKHWIECNKDLEFKH